MPLRTMLSALAICLAAAQAMAQGGYIATPRATVEERARTAPLLEALAMGELLEIMRQEGLVYAGELQADLFSGRGGERWPDMVSRIFDTGRMEELMLDEMAADIAAWHLTPLEEFFTSDLGSRIIKLEITARRAMLEPSVEAATREVMETMRREETARFALLTEFVDANDLVEMNVVGALNANYAFLSGMSAAGALQGFAGEEDILRDVWRQEDEIRDETESWIFSYLAMAYQPLSGDEIGEYIELSRTEAGRVLNAALFGAFDELFQTISYDLGIAAAQFMSGEDL